MAKARIVVLQAVVFEDLVKQVLPPDAWDHVVPCEYFHAGQQFTVDGESSFPEGFCPAAWFDLRDKIAAALRDNDPLTPLLVCCQDGLRPVSFRIERIEDMVCPK